MVPFMSAHVKAVATSETPSISPPSAPSVVPLLRYAKLDAHSHETDQETNDLSGPAQFLPFECFSLERACSKASRYSFFHQLI